MPSTFAFSSQSSEFIISVTPAPTPEPDAVDSAYLDPPRPDGASAGSSAGGGCIQERVGPPPLPPRSGLCAAPAPARAFRMRAVSLARLGREVEEQSVGKRHSCFGAASSTADGHTRLDLAEKGEPQPWAVPAAAELKAELEASAPCVDLDQLDQLDPRLVSSGAARSPRLALPTLSVNP